MDESEIGRFREAERIWQSGSAVAAQIHFDLSLNGQDPRIRLASAEVLIDRLKLPRAPEQLLEVCAVGIQCARQLADSRDEALFMAKRAEYLVTWNGLTLLPARKRLRMAPGWFAFSLERDEKRYAELTKQIEANEREADDLTAAALTICDTVADRSTKGRVLMSVGTIAFQRYLDLKLEALPSRIRVPGWLLARLREHCFDEYVLYDSHTRRKMPSFVEEDESSFIEAAQLCRDAGEDETAAYAFYNLANTLRSAYRFSRALRHLNQAR